MIVLCRILFSVTLLASLPISIIISGCGDIVNSESVNQPKSTIVVEVVDSLGEPIGGVFVQVSRRPSVGDGVTQHCVASEIAGQNQGKNERTLRVSLRG